MTISEIFLVNIKLKFMNILIIINKFINNSELVQIRLRIIITKENYSFNVRDDSTIPVGPPGGPKIMLAAPKKLWQN